MVWIGIGLIVIGLGILALTVVLIKPLVKVTSVLDDMKKTTKDLPETLNSITGQVNNGFDTGISTLQQVNTQLKELTPIFHIVGDVGRTTQQLSSNMVNAVKEFKHKETPSLVSQKNLEGVYGAITLSIIVFQKVKEFTNERKIVDHQ